MIPINIPGINTETGLALYNGDAELYVDVLRSYVPNAQKVIARLRAVSQAVLPDYAVQVHGLKSISAGIGAEQVRAAAADLERATKLEPQTKPGDCSAITAGNKALLEATENLVSGIQAWLAEFDREHPRPRIERPDPALLGSLRKSCEAYDIKGIDDAMDELECSDYNKDASLIVWLREKINALDFASVAARLAEYGKEPP
jgi:HPt (histidine-containing phosphotransfer) domain-containing protein